MSDRSNIMNTRIFLGLVLIAIGGIFLLDSLGFIDLELTRVIFSFPFALIVIGLLVLINSRKKFWGLLIAGIGLLYLLRRIDVIDFETSAVLPIFIILLGVYLILRRGSHRESFKGTHFSSMKGTELNINRIDEVSVFGGSEKAIVSENFQGGSITSIFGGSEIDLSRCKLAPGKNVLDVLAIFGGSELHVPKEWNVIVDVTPIFGGFSSKGFRDPNLVPDPDRSLVIKGLVLFGGGEIKRF